MYIYKLEKNLLEPSPNNCRFQELQIQTVTCKYKLFKCVTTLPRRKEEDPSERWLVRMFKTQQWSKTHIKTSFRLTSGMAFSKSGQTSSQDYARSVWSGCLFVQFVPVYKKNKNCARSSFRVIKIKYCYYCFAMYVFSFIFPVYCTSFILFFFSIMYIDFSYILTCTFHTLDLYLFVIYIVQSMANKSTKIIFWCALTGVCAEWQ